MYPGIILEYNDQSDIPVNVPLTEVRNKPLFGAVFTSDKGPEKWMRLSGEEFFKAYGNTISFAKHGQPLLQTAMTINAGAEVLCKRLVADDATLANIGIVVSVVNTTRGVEVQVTDADGNLLYLDDNGAETTEVTDTPYMKTETYDGPNTIQYSVVSATKAKTIEEAKKEIEGSLTSGQKLLYVIADNGRGVSNKRIKIVPNYKLSKSLTYVLYTLSVIEKSTELESMSFSINPDLIVSNSNISLPSMVNTHSTQITCIGIDENIEWLAKTVASSVSIINEDTNIYQHDVLFARTNRGEALSENILISSDGIDLQNSSGQKLDGGSNGALGDYPFSDTAEVQVTDVDGNLLYLNSDGKETTTAEGNTPYMKKVREEYIKQGVAALTGDFDTVIFNVDQYMLTCCVDANYPDEIKTAFASLSNFRQDFVFFRDMGLNKTDFDLVSAALSNIPNEDKSMFCATYCQSYDVIDPYTKKQITVTIGYDLAQKLVAHCSNGCILPTAGMKYGMIIDNAIYGTLSFAPTICPEEIGYEGNQKEKLDDMRVNYASYINNQLVIESLYTSQEANSQWSYINNVMGIQEVVKAIRTRCPAIRYTFIDGEDLDRYKEDVEEVIAPFQNNFKHLSLEYIADTTYSANKIFYAALKVVYKDFVQTEWFKVTALSTVEVSES